MSIKYPINSTSGNAFSRSGPMVTPKDIKERYLFGVDLTDEDDNVLPDKVIQHHIDTAVSYLEHKLDIVITPTTFVEKYDYRSIDYTEFNFISLKHRPVCEVTDIRAKFPNNVDLVQYPTEWYVLEKEGGQIQLSPVEGTFSGLIITQGGSYLPLIYGTRAYWPHLFQVTYKAGFDADCIPIMINDMIGMQASIRLFEIFGDIVLGPGVASESVGLDGANVSKGLTASAMFSAYSARIESYKKQMDDYIKVVREHYNGFPFTVG